MVLILEEAESQQQAVILCLTGHDPLLICIIGKKIKGVEQFLYVGSIVSTNAGNKVYVARRIHSGKPAFSVLSKIWKGNYVLISRSRTVSVYLFQVPLRPGIDDMI